MDRRGLPRRGRGGRRAGGRDRRRRAPPAQRPQRRGGPRPRGRRPGRGVPTDAAGERRVLRRGGRRALAARDPERRLLPDRHPHPGAPGRSRPAGRCGSPGWSTARSSSASTSCSPWTGSASTSPCRACRTRSAATWSATPCGPASRSPTSSTSPAPDPAASQIVGRAVDGWTAGFPTELATDGRPAMVAVAMNGEPLPVKHGFPARLVVPGLYGYVSATKWLTEIELTTLGGRSTATGSREAGPRRARSRPSRASTSPGPARRFPPDRPRSPGWRGRRPGRSSGSRSASTTVRGSPPACPARCRRTRGCSGSTPGTPPPDATDSRCGPPTATGETQTAEAAPPAPSGATGHHTISVEVT